MKIIAGIVLFISVIIETTIYPYPVTLIILSFISTIWENEAVYFALLSGIFTDIFGFRLVGTSGLFFISIIIAKERFQSKFHQGWMYYQFFTVNLIMIGYIYFYYKKINIWEILTLLFLNASLFIIRAKVLGKELDRKKLTVI